MKYIRLITTFLVLLAYVASCHADQKDDCQRQFDQQLRDSNAAITSYAGIASYTQMRDKALQCIASGRCGKADALIALQEMMVDEEVINLQRKKIHLLKIFLADRQSKNDSTDVCSLVKYFPEVMIEIKALNDAQFMRWGELAKERFGPGQ